ncbi:hypothetical protein J2X69_001031 [Algoriphagus sp. 4150]|uniref:hypothetical protein n=1 Tax=Algoriphagus sp. 4150 TaxID=2817756 RepID=UPI00285FB989|nr:hypothetical protein [Algoriphagus sp. 4150]MDR7128699.1 hypothetical protein [Algoriphagus sp. 4150]
MQSTILDQQKVNEFMVLIKSKSFFSLSQDSLNWDKKDLGNGTILHQSIMDGVSENFEVISSSDHRIYSAHEPIQRQEFVFNNQRKIFLDCLDKFLDLIGKTK